VLNDLCEMIQDLKADVRAQEAKIDQDELHELRLRDRNPALKEAWDQYQTVKGLIK